MAVEEQGVLAVLEQLGEPDRLGGVFLAIPFLEGVVARNYAAERQLPPLRGDGLDLPPQVDLRLQEFVARPPVLVRLTRENAPRAAIS